MARFASSWVGAFAFVMLSRATGSLIGHHTDYYTAMHTNFAAVYNTKMMPNRVTLFALFSSGLTFVDRIVA